MKNNNVSKKTLGRIIGYIILLIPFVTYPEYVLGNALYQLFHIYFAVSCMLFIILALLRRPSMKNLAVALIPVLIFLPSLVSAINNNYTEAILSGAKLILGCFSFVLFIVTLASKDKKSFRVFLSSIAIFYGIVTFLNILSFVLFYPGMGPKSFYLIGSDNGSIFETHLFVFASLLYFWLYRNETPKWFFLLLLIIFLGYMFVRSGNGMVFSLAFLFAASVSRKKMHIPTKTFLVIYSFLLITIVLLNDTSIISPILTFLGKDATVSGRTYIWSLAPKYIKQQPIFGVGFEPQWLTTQKIWINRAHNLMLQLLYTGGAYLLISGILLTIRLLKKSKALRTSMPTIFILIFLMMGIMDFYIYKMTTVIFFALIFSQIILEKRKNEENKNNYL